MKKDVFKNSCKIASNILLVISLMLLVLAVWLNEKFLGLSTLVVSITSIAIVIISQDQINIKTVLSDLNLYFFLVSIILSISVILDNKSIFYIGIVLFILVLFLYFISIFVEEKDIKKKKK